MEDLRTNNTKKFIMKVKQFGELLNFKNINQYLMNKFKNQFDYYFFDFEFIGEFILSVKLHFF